MGNRVPNYLVLNLMNIKKTFPGARIIFFSDNKDNISRIKSTEIETYFCQIPCDLLERHNFYFKNQAKFRNGFWFFTYARLIMLSEIMKNLGLASALQVEGDVFLFPNFPYETFSTIKNIAFPLTDPTKGVASTVWIGSQKAAENLESYVMESLNVNPYLSDMDILGSYWRERPSEVTILPSNVNDNDFFATNISQEEKEILTKNIDLFRGIFDGNTIGQFLTGLDPANDWGRRRVFVHQPKHKIDPRKMKFIFENGVLKINGEGKMNVPIFSLHIHSKDLRVFDHSESKQYFLKRTSQGTEIPLTEFVLRKFLHSSFHWVLKRLGHFT